MTWYKSLSLMSWITQEQKGNHKQTYFPINSYNLAEYETHKNSEFHTKRRGPYRLWKKLKAGRRNKNQYTRKGERKILLQMVSRYWILWIHGIQTAMNNDYLYSTLIKEFKSSISHYVGQSKSCYDRLTSGSSELRKENRSQLSNQ